MAKEKNPVLEPGESSPLNTFLQELSLVFDPEYKADLRAQRRADTGYGDMKEGLQELLGSRPQGGGTPMDALVELLPEEVQMEVMDYMTQPYRGERDRPDQRTIEEVEWLAEHGSTAKKKWAKKTLERWAAREPEKLEVQESGIEGLTDDGLWSEALRQINPETRAPGPKGPDYYDRYQEQRVNEFFGRGAHAPPPIERPTWTPRERSARLQESDAEWAAGEEERQQTLDEANQALNNFLEVYKTAGGIQESVPGSLDMLDAFSEYSNQAGIERQAMEEGTMPPPRPQPVAPPAPATNVAPPETPSPSETPLTTSKKKKTDKDWKYYLNKAGISEESAKKHFGIDVDKMKGSPDSASIAAPKKGESKSAYRKRLEEFFKSDKGRGVIAKSSDFEEKLERRNKAILSQRRAWGRTGFGSVDAHGIPSKGALTSAEMNSFSAQLNTTEEAIKRLMDKIGTSAESPTDIQQLNSLRAQRTALQDALQRSGGGTGSFLDRYTRKHVIPSLVRGMGSYNQVLPSSVVANPSNAYMFMPVAKPGTGNVSGFDGTEYHQPLSDPMTGQGEFAFRDDPTLSDEEKNKREQEIHDAQQEQARNNPFAQYAEDQWTESLLADLGEEWSGQDGNDILKGVPNVRGLGYHPEDHERFPIGYGMTFDSPPLSDIPDHLIDKGFWGGLWNNTLFGRSKNWLVEGAKDAFTGGDEGWQTLRDYKDEGRYDDPRGYQSFPGLPSPYSAEHNRTRQL